MTDQDAAASPGPGGAGDQWQVRVVDTIDDVVTAVQERLVDPLVLVARGVVFGLIVGAMTMVVSITLSIALVRILDVYAFRGRAWATDVLLGGLLAVGGLALWTRRRPRRKADAT